MFLATHPKAELYLKRASDQITEAKRAIKDGEDLKAKQLAERAAIDAEVVAQLMRRRRAKSTLDRLTSRELDVLGLMAEGRSNVAIAEQLGISQGGVEKHISNVFTKLDLFPASEDHRRVLAVLTYLGQ